MKFAFLFLIAGLAISAPLAQAQPTPAPAPLTSASATAAALDPAAATRAWLETVPAEKRAKSDAYFEGRYWLILWNFLLGAVIAIFFLASGLSARLRDLAERVTRSRILRPALYAVPYVVIVYLLSFPLLVYSDFFREHAFGLANQSFGPWFGEQLIESDSRSRHQRTFDDGALRGFSPRAADLVALGIRPRCFFSWRCKC